MGTIRQRCADCYEDVAPVLTRLGFSLDESVWIYGSDLNDDAVRQLLRGTQRYLMQVAWMNMRVEHSSAASAQHAQQDLSSAASAQQASATSAQQDISVNDADQSASSII